MLIFTRKYAKTFALFKVGARGKIFQFQGACFGLNILPELWMDLMKVLEKEWRKQGILCFVYLDDILILGSTKNLLEKHLNIVLSSLVESGLTINQKRSVLYPCQKVAHLGFQIDLQAGRLQVPP